MALSAPRVAPFQGAAPDGLNPPTDSNVFLSRNTSSRSGLKVHGSFTAVRDAVQDTWYGAVDALSPIRRLQRTSRNCSESDANSEENWKREGGGPLPFSSRRRLHRPSSAYSNVTASTVVSPFFVHRTSVARDAEVQSRLAMHSGRGSKWGDVGLTVVQSVEKARDLQEFSQSIDRQYDVHSGMHKMDADAFLTELLTATELRGVILPSSSFRSTWDVLTLLFVVWTIMWLPIAICFEVEAPEPLRLLDYMIDIVFIVDVFLNFRTAYLDNRTKRIVVNRGEIAQNYLAHWFPVDALSSIPWDLIFLIIRELSFRNQGDTAWAQLIKILKAPKLLRLSRFFKFLDQVSSMEGAANITKIIGLLFFFFIAIHFVGCFFFFVASRGGNGYNWAIANNLMSEVWYVQYFESLYASMMMMMGDSIGPTRPTEVAFAVSVTLVGACMNASLFAGVASLVAQLNHKTSVYQQREERIIAALHRLGIDDHLSARVHAYYDYLFVVHDDNIAADFLQQVPVSLRTDIAYAVYQGNLRSLPLFRKCDTALLQQLATKLNPVFFLPGDVVLRAGELDHSMFFIKYGVVEILIKGKSVLGAGVYRRDSLPGPFGRDMLSMGYFGERTFLFNTLRSASVRAHTYLHLLQLTQGAFTDALKASPIQALELCDIARELFVAKDFINFEKTVTDAVCTNFPALRLWYDAKRSAAGEVPSGAVDAAGSSGLGEVEGTRSLLQRFSAAVNDRTHKQKHADSPASPSRRTPTAADLPQEPESVSLEVHHLQDQLRLIAGKLDTVIDKSQDLNEAYTMTLTYLHESL